MRVDLTYLGEGGTGPFWQAQPQELNSAFGNTQAEARAAFVTNWNAALDDDRSEDDFEWVQQGGPPEGG